MDEDQIKVGDEVIVRCWSNEMDGQQGTVIRIIDDNEPMPIMVQFCNFREWPYGRGELELQR
jgi:predicted transcriptional regulator